MIALLVFLFRPHGTGQPATSDTPSDWKEFSNPELGVSFFYPPEWGEVTIQQAWNSKALLIGFSNAHDFSGQFSSETSLEDFSKTCAQPKAIVESSNSGYGLGIGTGYCKLFTNDSNYLLEVISVSDLNELSGAGMPVAMRLTQRAQLKFDSGSLQITQAFSDDLKNVQSRPYLQSILDRTAPADILEKIDTFEQVMLTLEVK